MYVELYLDVIKYSIDLHPFTCELNVSKFFPYLFHFYSWILDPVFSISTSADFDLKLIMLPR